MRAMLFGLGVILFSASAAQAQSAPASVAASTAPEPARMAAAVELIEVMRIRDLIRDMTGPMMDGMLKGMIEGMTKGSPKMAADRAADPYFDERMRRLTKIMSAEMDGFLTELMPELVRSYEVAYARAFTLPELRGQVEFYRSPVGQSVAAKTPEVARISSQIMMQTMMPRVAAMGERMKALQPKIEAALADLPPPPKPAS